MFTISKLFFNQILTLFNSNVIRSTSFLCELMYFPPNVTLFMVTSSGKRRFCAYQPLSSKHLATWGRDFVISKRSIVNQSNILQNYPRVMFNVSFLKTVWLIYLVTVQYSYHTLVDRWKINFPFSTFMDVKALIYA